MGILVLAKPAHFSHPTDQQLDGEVSVAVIPAGLQQEEALHGQAARTCILWPEGV